MTHMQNPSHPGEILRENYIKPLGMSVRALSIALHISYQRIRETVNGTRGVSADMALRLERYFGRAARDWLALQAAHDLWIAEKTSGEQIKREITPLTVDAQALKGQFQKPKPPVSIKAMNKAIAAAGAKAAVTRMHNPPHPGEVLLEYLGKTSIIDAAAKLGVEPDELSDKTQQT